MASTINLIAILRTCLYILTFASIEYETDKKIEMFAGLSLRQEFDYSASDQNSCGGGCDNCRNVVSLYRIFCLDLSHFLSDTTTTAVNPCGKSLI
jgi:hypothetical protein